MKLQLTGATGIQLFTGYGAGYVLVNGTRHATSVIVLPERILPWEAERFDTLAEAHFAALADMQLEVLLLGTGPLQRFPHPRLTQALARARTGVEVMDTGAACRTYNILAAESRRVAAALLFA